MGYCPAFLNFENKKVLLVGGGIIATRKLKVLLDFTKNITIISRSCISEMEEMIKNNQIKYFLKGYEKGDIKSFDIAIIAVDDIPLQEQIVQEVKNQKILCNYADLPQYCDFSFGAYFKKEDLIISISTNGGAPSIITELKIWLDKKIPNSLIEFIKEIKIERESLPKGEQRMEYVKAKTKSFFDKLD